MLPRLLSAPSPVWVEGLVAIGRVLPKYLRCMVQVSSYVTSVQGSAYTM